MNTDSDFMSASPALEGISGRDDDSGPWLSVVLPAHNEAENIGAVVRDFLRATRSLGRPVEVIVIDDGSTDGTADAANVGSEWVRVVRRDRNGGYGAALTTGFSRARGDWVFFTDGDGQFGASQLPGFLRRALDGSADMVVGYRHPRADRWSRRALGRTWSTLVRLTFQVSVRDVNCAYKAMRRADLSSMKITTRGAMINAELLHKASQLDLRIDERPVSHRARQHGEPTGAKPRVMGRALLDLARYRATSWLSGYTRGPTQ
jgi:glycosyltransferase involved in cell wall biosynthesis